MFSREPVGTPVGTIGMPGVSAFPYAPPHASGTPSAFPKPLHNANPVSHFAAHFAKIRIMHIPRPRYDPTISTI